MAAGPESARLSWFAAADGFAAVTAGLSGREDIHRVLTAVVRIAAGRVLDGSGPVPVGPVPPSCRQARAPRS